MDDAGSAYTSKDMFAGSKADVDFVQVKTPQFCLFLTSFICICQQVLVAIDARPNIKIKAISHKQFVEFVGTHDVPGKPNIEQVRFEKFRWGLEYDICAALNAMVMLLVRPFCCHKIQN